MFSFLTGLNYFLNPKLLAAVCMIFLMLFGLGLNAPSAFTIVVSLFKGEGSVAGGIALSLAFIYGMRWYAMWILKLWTQRQNAVYEVEPIEVKRID